MPGLRSRTSSRRQNRSRSSRAEVTCAELGTPVRGRPIGGNANTAQRGWHPKRRLELLSNVAKIQPDRSNRQALI